MKLPQVYQDRKEIWECPITDIPRPPVLIFSNPDLEYLFNESAQDYDFVERIPGILKGTGKFKVMDEYRYSSFLRVGPPNQRNPQYRASNFGRKGDQPETVGQPQSQKKCGRSQLGELLNQRSSLDVFFGR